MLTCTGAQVIAALCVLLLVATVSVHAVDSESVSESGVSMVHEIAEGAEAEQGARFLSFDVVFLFLLFLLCCCCVMNVM
jgi:hypothetical protein